MEKPSKFDEISIMRVMAMTMIIAYHSLCFYSGRWTYMDAIDIPFWSRIAFFLNEIDLICLYLWLSVWLSLYLQEQVLPSVGSHPKQGHPSVAAILCMGSIHGYRFPLVRLEGHALWGQPCVVSADALLGVHFYCCPTAAEWAAVQVYSGVGGNACCWRLYLLAVLFEGCQPR